MPTMHLSEVTKERVALLYVILLGKKINVGQWIQHNINHAIRQGSGGIPHPTMLSLLHMALILKAPKYSSQKGRFNKKGIERILAHWLREKVTGASSSGARAPCPARASQTCTTIADLIRAVERHEA